MGPSYFEDRSDVARGTAFTSSREVGDGRPPRGRRGTRLQQCDDRVLLYCDLLISALEPTTGRDPMPKKSGKRAFKRQVWRANS